MSMVAELAIKRLLEFQSDQSDYQEFLFYNLRWDAIEKYRVSTLLLVLVFIFVLFISLVIYHRIPNIGGHYNEWRKAT